MAGKFFLKQPMMNRVLISIVPIFCFSFFLYGINVLLLSVVVFAGGILTEYIFEKKAGKKVSTAILVTCSLFVLSLPPSLPWWMALIGIVFGIVFAKEVYGGFGKNIFNPAVVSRVFIYLAFAGTMTSGWIKAGNFGINAVSQATQLFEMRSGNSPDLTQLFFGLRGGSIGESPIFLIILAAVYLIWTKTASWRIILSTGAGGLILALILDLFRVSGALAFLPSAMAGSFLFIVVFMATDPVSAPKKKPAQFIYGLIIGSSSILIRTFSVFPEGSSFGILIGNVFSPFLDSLFQKKKVKR